jgi:MFS superfamily sulfate permease-like transporter
MTTPDMRDESRPRDDRRWRKALHRYVPITAWLPVYPRGFLRSDIIAGVTIWGVMVPVGMAYAQMAGVPTQVGLYTAFAALLGYAVFDTSRHLKVTASSTMAVMSAAVVRVMAQGDAARYMAFSSALAFTVGIILLAAGIIRLGFISDFLSKSVVTGFVFGLALVIAVGQAPKVLGLTPAQGDFFEQLGALIANLPQINLTQRLSVVARLPSSS